MLRSNMSVEHHQTVFQPYWCCEPWTAAGRSSSVRLTCLISVLNHVIACMWYGVGNGRDREWATDPKGRLVTYLAGWLANLMAQQSRTNPQLSHCPSGRLSDVVHMLYFRHLFFLFVVVVSVVLSRSLTPSPSLLLSLSLSLSCFRSLCFSSGLAFMLQCTHSTDQVLLVSLWRYWESRSKHLFSRRITPQAWLHRYFLEWWSIVASPHKMTPLAENHIWWFLRIGVQIIQP